ncbi:hypothetical protein SAMN06265222_101736 [Neorhodopirellula lusitana]|uniref:Uncharacterized protein n=1 Tax=Neorhodopirellula lusitana TaxID=445327 RepID=A0ABY1PQ62_9BACT|nr:hypothetical protein SAMN06265222_101736 [Neorhodopirellula lusitana]
MRHLWSYSIAGQTRRFLYSQALYTRMTCSGGNNDVRLWNWMGNVGFVRWGDRQTEKGDECEERNWH